MRINQYQVDAFARRVFEGSPAAVCVLPAWLDDKTLQIIAAENNLPATAFVVPTQKGFQLRWFTPVAEEELCGHATLASAHVIFEELGSSAPIIEFETRAGMLLVEKVDGMLAMNFPSLPPAPCAAPPALIEGLGQHPLQVLAAHDYIAVFENEAAVRALAPDFAKLKGLDLRGVCATGPGLAADFVSRFFAPKLGVPEDPVTGSTHCELAPYWSLRLGKTALMGFQASARGGYVQCVLKGDRVVLSGSAVIYMKATIEFGI